jgi:putative membrane protein insertion efficiency factor
MAESSRLSKIVSYMLIGLVWGYRVTVGPFLGAQCRFLPTCSQYALDAIQKHGPIRGSWRAVKRVGRCHPFSRGGYDPA